MNMKWHNLIDIYNALEKEEHEIDVDKNIAEKALKCIDRMLEVSSLMGRNNGKLRYYFR